MMIDNCKVHLGWPRHGWPSAPMTRRINEVPSKINLTNKFFYIRCVFCLHGSIVWIFYLVESHFKKLLYILRNISGIN